MPGDVASAADALAISTEALRPRPTIEDVLQRVAIHAAEGSLGLGWRGELPARTIAELEARGFGVKAGPAVTTVDWSAGAGGGCATSPASKTGSSGVRRTPREGRACKA